MNSNELYKFDRYVLRLKDFLIHIYTRDQTLWMKNYLQI